MADPTASGYRRCSYCGKRYPACLVTSVEIEDGAGIVKTFARCWRCEAGRPADNTDRVALLRVTGRL